jgi:DNA-binding PadR family transcriptional regulator
VFGILLALGDGGLHGYGIMQALKEKTHGREQLLPGSLYASIVRMIDEGLVEEVPLPASATSGGPRRRNYRRTKFGTAVARAESERMRLLVNLARSEGVLRGPTR